MDYTQNNFSQNNSSSQNNQNSNNSSNSNKNRRNNQNNNNNSSSNSSRSRRGGGGWRKTNQNRGDNKTAPSHHVFQTDRSETNNNDVYDFQSFQQPETSLLIQDGQLVFLEYLRT